MNRTSNGISGVLENLRNQLAILEEEIKADEDGKAEYERTLGQLEVKRAEIQSRLDANSDWASTYALEIGPFEDRYNNMTANIGDIYNTAKKGHKRGVELLKKEFGYHPEFKRPGDTFTAVPFRPA